jgi:hypothetical protein
LHNACCTLHACCMLYVARCMMHAARCMQHACCMLQVACCILQVPCMLYVAHCTNLHEVRDERVSAARAHMITYVSARQPHESHLHRERAQNKRVGCTTRRRANSGRKADTAEAQTMLARPDIPSGCSRELFGL